MSLVKVTWAPYDHGKDTAKEWFGEWLKLQYPERKQFVEVLLSLFLHSLQTLCRCLKVNCSKPESKGKKDKKDRKGKRDKKSKKDKKGKEDEKVEPPAWWPPSVDFEKNMFDLGFIGSHTPSWYLSGRKLTPFQSAHW